MDVDLDEFGSVGIILLMIHELDGVEELVVRFSGLIRIREVYPKKGRVGGFAIVQRIWKCWNESQQSCVKCDTCGRKLAHVKRD